MFSLVLVLAAAGAVALASSALFVTANATDDPLLWVALFANAAVVLFTTALGVRVLRRRAPANVLGEQNDQNAQSATLTVDHEGTVLTWSEEAEALTGYSAEQSIGNAFSFLLPPVTADIGLQTQLLRTATQADEADTECWLVKADGTRVWVHLSLCVLSEAVDWDRRFCLVFRLLAENATAREALRQHEANLQQMVDCAPDAIVTIDDERRILLFNPAAGRIFGCTRQQAVGQPFDRFLPHGLEEQLARLASSEPASRSAAAAVLRGAGWEGNELLVEASISRSQVQERTLYTVIARDVTARVRAEQALQRTADELRSLASALQAAREDERASLAHELRDELAESMAALKSDITWLGRELRQQSSKGVLDRLRAMGSLLDQLVAHTRRLSADLRPPVLDDLGFAAATEWLVKDFRQRTGKACECNLDATIQNVSEPLATALFRTLQDSLTDLSQHADATRVQIDVGRENGVVLVQVSGDGKPEVAGDPIDQSSSLTLRGLKQRALALGGDATVRAATEGGTHFVFRVPVGACMPSDRTASRVKH